MLVLQPHCGWNKPCAAGDLVGLWRVTEPIFYKNTVAYHGGLDRLEQLTVAGLMRRIVCAQLRRLTCQYQRMQRSCQLQWQRDTVGTNIALPRL